MTASPNVVRGPLSRRALLKGSGVALALPWLDAMTPAVSRAAEPSSADPGAGASEPPRRFVGVLTNMGILPQFFFPTNPGRDYDSTPYLDLLKDHRDQLTVFSGVSLPDVDGGHAAELSFLTGAAHPGRGAFRNTISLDQLIAERVGHRTRFPSLTLMIGADALSLSWTRGGSKIPAERSPLKLYQKLFVEDAPAAREAAERRLREDRSLLDAVREQAKQLERELGPADRDRLDQYYTAVRDLERRLAKAEEWAALPKPVVNAAAPAEIKDHDDLAANTRAMFDLMKLALETDSTRSVTLCSSLASVTPRKIDGVRTNTHELSHHGNRPEKLAELRRIEEAQFKALAEFLAGLRGVKENDATLLDRTAVLYGTHMGSANAHSNDNLPVLLAGGGFKHGQHLAFDRKKNYPLTNLYVSLLQRLGVETDRFSSGTTTMRGLETA